jgi:predicted nucleic acid-binding protein
MLNTHDYGFALSERYGFSIYDGMILASALLADCGILFTEDLQNGQSIDDKLIVKNPFLAQCP